MLLTKKIRSNVWRRKILNRSPTHLFGPMQWQHSNQTLISKRLSMSETPRASILIGQVRLRRHSSKQLLGVSTSAKTNSSRCTNALTRTLLARSALSQKHNLERERSRRFIAFQCFRGLDKTVIWTRSIELRPCLKVTTVKIAKKTFAKTSTSGILTLKDWSHSQPSHKPESRKKRLRQKLRLKRIKLQSSSGGSVAIRMLQSARSWRKKSRLNINLRKRGTSRHSRCL